MQTPIERLDALISEKEAELNKLRNVREVLRDESVNTVLSQVYGVSQIETPSTSTQMIGSSSIGKRKRPKVADQIIQSMNNGKEWWTVRDLEGLGMNTSAIRQVLYRTHRDKFDRRSSTGGGKASFFRLKRGNVAIEERYDSEGKVVDRKELGQADE